MAKSKHTIPNPYDSCFHTSISMPEIAIPFCQINLPPSLSSKINYSTMKVAKHSFVNKELRQYASDVILTFELKPPKKQTTTQPQQLEIAIIIEHQSTPDKFMPFRIFHYMFGYLYEQYKQRKSNNELLTPVYPLLFYNGSTSPYPYPMELKGNFNDPYNIMEQVFNNEIKVIDVQQLEENDLKTQALLGLMIRAMRMRNINDHIVDYLKDFFIDLHLLITASNDADLPRLKDYRQTLIAFLASINELKDLHQAIEDNEQIPKTVRGEYMTAAEHFRQEGRIKERHDLAINALQKGLEIEFVADLTKLDIQTVTELKENLDK